MKFDLRVKVKFDIHSFFRRGSIDVQYISYVYLALIRCYWLLKCDDTVYDLDLRFKVKFDIIIDRKSVV